MPEDRQNPIFLMPAEQRLSAKFLASGSRAARLAGISRSAPRHQFFWARNAIFHGLKALGVSPGESVLVPAYICAVVVEAMEAFGAKVVPYGIQRDCTVDFSDLQSKLDAGARALLAVHYFGFPRDIHRVREICDQRGLFLIEDCAHVLLGDEQGRPLGSFGDASVFSWRKFLPLFDGGELVLNRAETPLSIEWQKESALFTLRVAKNLLEAKLSPGLFGILPPPGRQGAAAGAAPPAAKTAGQAGLPLHVNRNSASFEPAMVNFPMSRLSSLLLKHCDISGIAAQRRTNYLHLHDRLSAIEGIRPLFGDCPPTVCPWVFPVFFEQMPNAHLPLRKLGIPAVTWGGVRHSRISAAEFPAADFLYENLIFLPVHQDLAPNDLDLIVRAVQTVRQGSSQVPIPGARRSSASCEPCGLGNGSR